MSLPARLLVAVVCATAALRHGPAAEADARAQATLVAPARFHHLHLVAPSPPWLADYYTRLFVPASVTRGLFWKIDGVRGAESYLLVSGFPQGRPATADTAIWHFGWGSVSVGESYKRHYAKEVNWKPPYAGLESGFHLHLRSLDPYAAGRWYRDVLGGVLEESPPLARGGDLDDDRADAIVRFPFVAIALHRWSGPFVASDQGGNADHIAFTVRDPEAIRTAARRPDIAAHAGVRDPLADTKTLAIEGPDRIVIELVPGARGPAFWK